MAITVEMTTVLSDHNIRKLQNAVFAAVSGLRTLDLPEDLIATLGMGTLYGLTHFLKRPGTNNDIEVAYVDMFFHGLAAFCVKYGGTKLNEVAALVHSVGSAMYQSWDEAILRFQDAVSKGDQLDLVEISTTIPHAYVFWAIGSALGTVLCAGLFAVVPDRRTALEYGVVLGGCAGLCSAVVLAALGQTLRKTLTPVSS